MGFLWFVDISKSKLLKHIAYMNIHIQCELSEEDKVFMTYISHTHSFFCDTKYNQIYLKSIKYSQKTLTICPNTFTIILPCIIKSFTQQDWKRATIKKNINTRHVQLKSYQKAWKFNMNKVCDACEFLQVCWWKSVSPLSTCSNWWYID